MFINLSNHPSKNWSEKQRKCASDNYGPIVDIACPVVDASVNEVKIKELAKATVDQIKELNPSAVMCVGEFSFSYAVISELKNCGYKVFSTVADFEVKIADVDGISQRKIKYKFKDFVEYSGYDELIFSAPQKYNDIVLNCSNNFGSDCFDQKALEETYKLGSKIIDLPLQSVVDFDRTQWKKLINDYIEKINEVSPATIILDGEFHTWFALASILKRLGYRVICKCGNRSAKEIIDTDGNIQKITNYKFIRYRELEKL